MVSFEEIEKKNDFNLNIPRYIDSQTPENIQDIEGHLKGGIPVKDIEDLQRYWTVCPKLGQNIFKKIRPGYLELVGEKAAIETTIYESPEFIEFITHMNSHFDKWRKKNAETLRHLRIGCHPKEIITILSEELLAHYTDKPLINKYDIFQHLMDFWTETMQDDCYIIASDG
jgi:type I restriction enzyme M protein